MRSRNTATAPCSRSERWPGPYTLAGRRMHALRPAISEQIWTYFSNASFATPYAEVGLVGWSSVIGSHFGSPYTVPPEDTKITRRQLVGRRDSSRTVGS